MMITVIIHEKYKQHCKLSEKSILLKNLKLSSCSSHICTRTKLLLEEFSTAFTLADTIIILPIYASREEDDGSVSSEDLVEKTDNAIYMQTFEEVKKYLDKNAHTGSVVLTLGAGDVYRLYDIFKTEEDVLRNR